MQPNTPHYVVTPRAAICHGGHFYAMSTIRDTVYGVFHMFALSKSITNTEHSHASCLLLRRLVVYTHHLLVRGQFDHDSSPTIDPHIPNITTVEGSLDLFLLCIIAELGELLDPIAYRKQYRDDRELEHERLCTMHTRGLARELLEWWRGWFSFAKSNGDHHIDGKIVYQQLFAHQVKVLTRYKTMAEQKNMKAEEPACTGAAFESLVEKYFPHWHSSPIPDGASLDNFDWPAKGYTIVRQIQKKKISEPSRSESVIPFACTCLCTDVLK